MTDPYPVLGLTPPVTPDEVRAAYRARSMLLHPDLHQGRPEPVRREAERAMVQLTAAYEAALALAGRPGGPTRRGSPGGKGGVPTSGDGTAAYRLGRLAARSRLARQAGAAGQQDGGAAYRLGWLVGRRRPK